MKYKMKFRTAKTIFLLAIIFICAEKELNAQQYTLTDDDVIVNNGVIESCSYDFTITDIIIPETLDGQTVIGIADKTEYTDGVFYNKGITSVQFPSTLEFIGDNAFLMNNLTNIDLPGSITFIGYLTFYGNSLTNLIIPNSVVVLGDGVFSNNSLETVSISGNITKIGEGAFSYNNLTSITIPENVTEISLGAFESNNISSVFIPASIRLIGERAFIYNSLTSVTFEESSSIDSIGTRAFDENAVLYSITLPTHSNPGFAEFKDGNGNSYNPGDEITDYNTLYEAVINPLKCDSLALVALYNATDGPNWTNNENWLTGPIDTWYGVTIENNRVVKISLFGNHQNDFGLTGKLPNEIGNLDMLTYLNLSYNNLTDSIPLEIENLKKLKILYLNHNDFLGNIPAEIGELISLEHLGLHFNNFNGAIPSQLGNLNNLKSLLLYNNNLEGEIPSEIWTLTSLQTFYIHYNRLIGNIPEEIGNLINLNSLYLSNNQFTGSIPASIGNLSQLVNLFIDNCSLEGEIPEQVSSLTNLNWLVLSKNQLSGTLSSGMCDMPLEYIDLSENNFDSEICPTIHCLKQNGVQFGDSAQLQQSGFSLLNDCIEYSLETDSLALVALYKATDGPNWTNSTNWLTGPVGTWNGINVENGRVREIFLANNNLVGTIPPEIGQLSSLVFLNLRYNQLSDTLPSEIGQLSQLNRLQLGANNLTGDLPGTLSQINNLNILDLESNNFFGTIPSVIGQLQYLSGLHLANNNFTGAIPSVIGQLQYLNSLNLAFNSLEGNIPPELCQYTLDHIDLRKNNFDESSCSVISCLREQGVNFADSLQIQQSGFSLLNDCPDTTTIIEYNLETDSLALVALYNATNGPNWWNNSNWLDGPLSSWHGIYLQNGRVEVVGLGGNNLVGIIPHEIGTLTELYELTLYYNELQGSIPETIGNLKKLAGLDLSGNRLSGNIPMELGDVRNLEALFIRENELTGTLPTELCILPLTWCDFSRNNFNVNSCPTIECLLNKGVEFIDTIQVQNSGISLLNDCPDTMIYNFETDSLALVALYNATDGPNWKNSTNWLTNEPVRNWFGISVDNGRVTSINLWDYDGFGMTGELLPELGQLDSLEVLDLSFNSLTGGIPADLYNLSNLKKLYLNNNQLTGIIPSGIAALYKLQVLALGSNQISGNIPAEIGQLENLETLSLSNDQLTGAIPTELSGLQKLKDLYLYNNQLTGNIPDEIWSLPQLSDVRLFNNQLTGNLSPSIGNAESLVSLYMSNNQFEGEIPDEIWKLPKLENLNLGLNQLTGTISVAVANADSLSVLKLYSNDLEGTIPDEIWSIPNLTWLDLDDNQLTGSISPAIANANKLTNLLLSWNQLSGDLPVELTNTLIVQFTIKDNLFEGEISDVLPQMPYLNDLRIDNNKFTGTIPESLLKKLEVFTLSNNLFDTMPDINDPVNLNYLFEFNNNLTFEDLEYNMDFTVNYNHIYAPQNLFGQTDTVNIALGDTLLLHIPCGGTQNSYRWFKDSVAITDWSTSDMFENSGFTELDAGDYYVEVKNSLVPNLILNSYSIKVNVLQDSPVPVNEQVSNLSLTNGIQDCFNATNTITVAGDGSQVVVQSGGSANFIAGQKIRFLPGFHAQEGSYTHGYITTTGDYCVEAEPAIVAAETANEKESVIVDAELTEIAEREMVVYPNPNNGEFTVEFRNFNDEIRVMLFNSIGQMVQEELTTDREIRMSISNFKSGIYFIKAINNQKQFNQKIVVR